MGRHFEWEVDNARLRYQRNAGRVEAEARPDGIHVLRASGPATRLSSHDTVRTYKGLADGERWLPLPQGP